MGDPRLAWGYSDRRRMGDQVVEKRPVVTKECAICTKLVDRETLFNGVCKECLDVDKEHCNEPR